MSSSHIIQRLRNWILNEEPTSHSSAAVSQNAEDEPNEGEQFVQSLEAILEVENLPEDFRRSIEQLRDLLQVTELDSPHWNRVKSIQRASKDLENQTAHELFQNTDSLGYAIRDAFEAEYTRYTRGHRIATQLVDHLDEMDLADAEVKKRMEHLAIIFEVHRESIMTNIWTASVRVDGLHLMVLKPEDDLGNVVLDHEAKRRVTNILLSTTAVVETVGQVLLNVHDDPVSEPEPLANIIDKLAANNLITEKEQETLHSVRELRNRVAHDLEDRTTLDWIEDFGELVSDCSTAIEAVEYPIEKRLETELPSEIADEFIENLSSLEFEEDTDWYSAAQASRPK